MTPSPKTPAPTAREKLVLAAILSGTLCLLLPQDAWAFFINTNPCHTSSSGGIAVITILSWIFAALFLVTAADNFFTAKRKKAKLNVKKISVDILACITLAGLPFISQALLDDYRWASGLPVSAAGGWLAYRLLRSESFKLGTAAVLAIAFAAVLSWPTVFYTYSALHPHGCVDGRLVPAVKEGKQP